jgi:hypothetical protein
MFPKAGLTGRAVRTNNTMRMAKSWGHGGAPVHPENADARLRDAALYITKLPKAVHDAPKWQAMEALRLVAEHNGPTMFARSDNRGQTTFPLFNRAAATKK